jgi:hypothetical protein
MDGSLVNANASRDSVHKGPPELIEALRKVYREEETKLTEDLPEEGGSGATAKRAKTAMVSQTDPDAAIVRKGKADVARPRYKNHRAVDDQCGVITSVCTTPADVGEDAKLPELIEQHQRHTGEKVTTVIADTQYGTNQNFALCQQRGIRSHMSDLRRVYTDSGARKGIFKEEDFQYDQDADSYSCPAGKQLQRAPKPDRQYWLYRGSKQICGNCPLRSQCTRSKHWRTIKRHIHHEQIQRARLESRSGWAKRDRKRRMHLIEGSFADAATHHGFKHARWRGLERQSIQDLMIATCQNVRLLLRYHPPKNNVAISAALPKQSPQAVRPNPPYIILRCSFQQTGKARRKMMVR